MYYVVLSVSPRAAWAWVLRLNSADDWQTYLPQKEGAKRSCIGAYLTETETIDAVNDALAPYCDRERPTMMPLECLEGIDPHIVGGWSVWYGHQA